MYNSFCFLSLGAGTGVAYFLRLRLRLLVLFGAASAADPVFFSAGSGSKDPKTPGSGSPALEKNDIFSPNLYSTYLRKKTKYEGGRGGGNNMIFWENIYP